MKYIFAAVFFLTTIVPVHADDSLVYAIAKQEAEIVGVNQEIDQTKSSVSQLQAQKQRHAEEFNDIGTKYDALRQQFTQHAESYNSACAGRPANTGNCQSQRAAVQSEHDRLEPPLLQMEQRGTELSAAMREDSNNITLAQFKVQKLTNYKSQLEAAVARLKANLAGHCTGITATSSLEEMKNKCGNVQFDGTSTDLMSCTTDKCRQYDSMHR